MIRISLGNIGSGKTANEVREMALNKSGRKYFSNIDTKIKNQINLKHEMIIKKVEDKVKKKRNGEIETEYKFKVNQEFWKSVKEPCSVVLDEAHAILNSRKSTSKVNVAVTDWIALLRRVLGQDSRGYGELVLITQLPNRIDVIAREMATQIRYHICHYEKECLNCGIYWNENSETPEPRYSCPKCNSQNVRKLNHKIEVLHFKNMDYYYEWEIDRNRKTYYRRYLVNDIEKYFPLYDTLQWDNMFSELY